MIRVLFLVICLASAAIGGVYDSKPVPQRKRHSVTDFIYPYFEFMAGVEKITTKIIKAGERVEKRKPCYTVGGNVN